MSTDQQQGQPEEERPSNAPAPENPPAFEHSGFGADSALARMKQWERRRAQLGSDGGKGDRPQAG
jgi:hypothetical protein